jgi:hypothetical protein
MGLGPGREAAHRGNRAQHQVAYHRGDQGTGEDADPVRDHVVVGACLEGQRADEQACGEADAAQDRHAPQPAPAHALG